jgi:hypothetical protein
MTHQSRPFTEFPLRSTCGLHITPLAMSPELVTCPRCRVDGRKRGRKGKAVP